MVLSHYGEYQWLQDFGDGFVAWLLLNDFKSITKGI